MRILGISAFYHDSAAALISDGNIVAAAQEERFTRRKHDPCFPRHAIEYCLRQGGAALSEVDYVVFYEKPFLKFERLLETYLALAPRGFRSFLTAMPLWVHEKLFQKNLLGRELTNIGDFDWKHRLLFAEHHLSHAASAFYPSPFREALILTMDGVGEWTTTSAALGSETRIDMLEEIPFPHSLGLLYSAFTYYAGFRVNSGEYKLMGLAPYGNPKYAQLILDRLVDLKADGSFRLNLDYFDYCTGVRMTNRRFDDLMGGPPRAPDEPIAQRHMDVAASVQSVLEEAVLRLTRALARETKARNLCLAGGCALNCVANGKVLRDGRFEEIWVQPASGDAGGALGAALLVWHTLASGQRVGSGDAMQGALLGPEFAQAEIEARLTQAGARFHVLTGTDLIERCAGLLARGATLGWFQGRMEFGPRALGSRSILADARLAEMQTVLNRKIKRRESFRPFAPAVLREDLEEWFDTDRESPYMLFTCEVAKGASLPATTHVDRSARVQTVDRERNPLFHALLSAFKRHTGCPVLVNTSFNVRGEPIVCTPEEAFRCFVGTGLDALAVGRAFLEKSEQSQAPDARYLETLEPD